MPETRPTQAHLGLSISLPQLVASVLASVSAAIVASFFGVTGTVVGTALGSLVATLGTAVYLHSITRTTAYLQRQGQRLTPARGWTAASRPDRLSAAGADPRRTAQAVAQRPATRSYQTARRTPDGPLGRALARFPLGRRFGWKGGLVAVVVVFVVAIGVVTAIEKMASATISHLVGGTQSPNGSTTVSRLFSGGSSPHKAPPPSPSTTSPSTTTPLSSPSTTLPEGSPSTTLTTTPPPSSTLPPSTTTTSVGTNPSSRGTTPVATTSIPSP